MTHDGFQLVRCYLASVRQINLVVAPLLRQVDLVALLAREGIQDRDCLLVGPAFFVRVTTSTHRHVDNRRDLDNARPLLGGA